MILSPSILKLAVAAKFSPPAAGQGGAMPPSLAPVLTVHGSEVDLYMGYLNWSPSDQTDSEGFSYTVQTRFNGGAWLLLEAGIPDLYYMVNPGNSPMPVGLYEYRVIPRNDAGNGPMSNVQGFTVVEDVPSESGDPLSGLFNRVRLQTYRSKEAGEVASYAQTIHVSGAGTAGVNGRYHLVSGTFVNDAGYYFVDQEALAQWSIKHASISPYEFYFQASVDNASPWDAPYTLANGSLPLPSVVSFMEPQYKVAGINATVDAVNTTWTDVITSTGQASQSNVFQAYATGYELGVPVLIGDGVDDWMTTSVLTSDLDARGALFAVFRVNDGATLNVHNVIGGANMGCALANNTTNMEWGLYKPGGWTARNPISTPPYKWVSFAATWDGLSFRYHCVSEGVNEAKSGTLPSPFSTNAVANIGIGTRRSNNILSYFPGRYIAVGMGDQYLSAADLEQAAEYGATLFPTL